MTQLEKTDAVDTAIESIVKLTEQVNRGLITPTEGSSQLVRILIDMKIAVIKDTFGDMQDKLSDIGQMFSEVIDSIEEAEFLSVLNPE